MKVQLLQKNFMSNLLKLCCVLGVFHAAHGYDEALGFDYEIELRKAAGIVND